MTIDNRVPGPMYRWTWLFAAWTAMLVTAPFAKADIWYVDASGSGGNGTSWAQAFTDLQDALESFDVENNDQIWVATGTYYPSDQHFGTGSRFATYFLPDGARIYGGFAGTETARSARNPTQNETILSGDIGTSNDNSDNCFHVVSIGDVETPVRLSGFTIRDGNADGNPTGDPPFYTVHEAIGAGILIGGPGGSQISSAIISACRFVNNTSHFGGPGAFAHGGQVDFVNCELVDNTSAVSSSAADLVAGPPPSNNRVSMTNCVFHRNYGAWGAVRTAGGGEFTLTNCTLYDNEAWSSGGGITFDLFSASGTGIATVYNCVVWGNTPDQISDLSSNGTREVYFSDVEDGLVRKRVKQH